MGIYLNPGRESFEMALKSEIFIDKTEMLHYLNSAVNTQQRYVSVSRPRRFGKTMAADRVCAYYGRDTDSRELFEKRKLAVGRNVESKSPWSVYLGAFDVIRIVITDFLEDDMNIEGMLSYLTDEVSVELMEAYPDFKHHSCMIEKA